MCGQRAGQNFVSLIIFFASESLSDGLTPGNLLCGRAQHQGVKQILIYLTAPVMIIDYFILTVAVSCNQTKSHQTSDSSLIRAELSLEVQFSPQPHGQPEYVAERSHP